MLKISVVDGQQRRQMIVEGALITPWTDELRTAGEEAKTDLQGRELVIDLRGLTTISPEGANLLLQLMRDKVKLQCGVHLRELPRQLARDADQHPQDADDPRVGGGEKWGHFGG
jgi:hypothetical protein